MTAKLVYDGGDDLYIPEEMGVPTPTQMQGTVLERLIELSGRICYDSLSAPTARGSVEYHKHLLDVKHYSVHEHAHFTLELDINSQRNLSTELILAGLLSLFVNMPDVFVRVRYPSMFVTLNLRHILEFSSYPNALVSDDGSFNVELRQEWEISIGSLLKLRLPLILEDRNNPQLGRLVKIVPPAVPQESFVSMFLRFSRVASHEMVRHRGNMSQRSGRYVDESQSEFFDHPLYLQWTGNQRQTGDVCKNALAENAKAVYDGAVRSLQDFAVSKGIDKATARKQARSAARFYLPHGLATEMIFTASVTHWRHIFKMRINAAADAEIRITMAQALGEMKKSRYAKYFEDMTLVPSPDGLGEVLA